MLLRPILLVCAFLAALSGVPDTVRTQEYETAARAAILIDHRSGDVLYAKNPDVPVPPASMSKLMTALLTFEEIREGNLSLDETLPVSERAWRMGGSRMFVEVGTRVKVDDLLRGIIIQSGNDACIVVAEALAGSEEAFVERMNRRAEEIGLENSHFANTTGWPHPDHVMSVRDLATVARKIINDFPEFYNYYSQREFEYNAINQHNRNPLLRANVPGVDGMKTGYTSEAGYGLVASAERDGRRLILVVAGLETPGQRRSESERLLEYGFRNFEEYRLFEAGETVVRAPVWLGAEAEVGLVAEDVIGVTLARGDRDDLAVRVLYDAPIPAPIEAGQTVGTVEITAPGIDPRQEPLIAGSSVEKAGMLGRMTGALRYLIWGPAT